MKIILLTIFWSFSAFSTIHYEIKSKKYSRCIKIKNTYLDLLECDGKDKWEISYDDTSGQATISSGAKNWYIINRTGREVEKGIWPWITGFFKTSRPEKGGRPTIGIHKNNPSDFIFNRHLNQKTENVTFFNDAEEKCLDVEKEEDKFILILNKCSDSISQKWDITKLKEVPIE
ncbi:MAG: hypothetical protein DRQ88_00590 [Epsilonproteobacteria bacterium]|nr:MAG: hypothetical protein DRQ89_03670 [Campylobacterota bacterium]RLA68133.1 MAG: hypothetical protein DRQ88_00590 [Campylobacterota bacterium]